MLRPPRLRVLVAMMLAAVSGCGQDDDERAISLRVAGELGSDVPSTIAWQVELDRAAKLVTVARETLILTNDVEDRVWGLTTWRGGRAFEIDPSLTPWDRGPLVAVAGDRVLLSERRSDEPGDTWMVAFDAANGGQLWSVQLDLSDARPLVVGDAVIVATRDNDAAGLAGGVRSIALADGSERWSLPLDLVPDHDPDRGDYDDTAPVLSAAGNTLAVRTGTSSVVLVDVTDARELGSFDAEGEIVAARPLARQGVVLVTEVVDPITARLHAVDADTAQLRWTVEASGAETWVSGSMLVLYGLDHDYEAHEIGNGESVWTAAGNYGRIVAESEGVLITERLAGFATSSGDLVWSNGAYAERVWFAPGVVITSDRDSIIALDLVSGDQRWSLPASSVVTAADGGVLVAEDDQYTLLDPTSGAELWTIARPDAASATALTHGDGTLFMSITDQEEDHSTVIALRPAA